MLNKGSKMHAKRHCKTYLAVLFFVVSLIFVPFTSHATEGRVVRVIDGDTVIIDAGSYQVRCRLYGIDAPETPKRGRSGQPYGLEAKKFLEGLILWKIVDFQVTGEKTYNRDVCVIRYGAEKKDVGLEMVANGYAWAYRRYLKPSDYSGYIAAEKEAKEHNMGLWGEPNSIPPWEFRYANIRRHDEHKQTHRFTCGKKRYCSQMSSCEEAMFYFHKCGLKRLDRDKDGVPCESLCR